ncbi:hypothetical protein EW093_00855 [Thiospirochaeta perfilievii]|uniref:Uncharacterized protein n=1 Tax=Thiospirochaeta perfilievii TaxID=252967 RepID=A0A5C1QAY1_9SPIO|nr:hypothetical protein [Thiospirochaeta perfilievii]QEN03312.1 hypothetical protein EW093_00855 [Thiospirochaeta perfilievii]
MNKYNDIYTDEFMCSSCRNLDIKTGICIKCDAGSNYSPMTFPVYNIVLMFLSLNEGLKIAKDNHNSDQYIITMQNGFIEALKFVLEPYGNINSILHEFSTMIMEDSIDYIEPKEIENAIASFNFYKQETKEEIAFRSKIGSIRPNVVACNNCKNKKHFNTEYCWSCDAGSNFNSGIRSINTIQKMFMFINTVIGEKVNKGQSNNIQLNMGIAEGLKWIIKPFTTEEELNNKYGFSYVSEQDIQSVINLENENFKNRNYKIIIGENNVSQESIETKVIQLLRESIEKQLVGVGDIDPEIENSDLIERWLSEIVAIGFADYDLNSASLKLFETLNPIKNSAFKKVNLDDIRSRISLSYQRFSAEVQAFINYIELKGKESDEVILYKVKEELNYVDEGSFCLNG